MDNVGEEKWNLEVYDPDLNMLTRQHQLTFKTSLMTIKILRKDLFFVLLIFLVFLIRDAREHLFFLSLEMRGNT